jgi:predicted Zn-dependent protease
MHVLIFLIFVLPVALRFVVAIIFPEQLKKWEGERAKQMLTQQFGALQENRLISEIGNRLAKEADVKASFFLSPATMVNAGALPDGTIIVWKGLLSKIAHRPDMLAGVLAHELGHLKHDHYLRQVYWVVLIQFVLGIFARPLAGALSRNIAGKVLNMGFSRFRERQADDEAIHIMRAAGFDPKGLIDLFDELSKQSGPMAFLGTHPDPKDRAQRIREQLGMNKEEDSEEVEWEPTVIPFPLRND